MSALEKTLAVIVAAMLVIIVAGTTFGALTGSRERKLARDAVPIATGEAVFDGEGELRLIFRTPNREDFVHLTCIEIRHCGAGSIQIMRRMRSMLENLMQTLPPHRHAELHRQLELLDRTIEGHYSFAEDIEIAGIPDSQGLGGSLGVQAAMHHHG